MAFGFFWVLAATGIAFHTLTSSHKWHSRKVRTATIAALTYGPAHFVLLGFEDVASIAIFIGTSALLSLALHAISRAHLAEPALQSAFKAGTNIAYRSQGHEPPFDNLDIEDEPAPTHTSTYTPPIKPITIEPEEDFTEGDEWEMFVPEGATA